MIAEGAWTRRSLLAVTTCLLAATAACSAATVPLEGRSGSDWSPAARTLAGTSVLASAGAGGFRLHTASGDKRFIPGMNLGSTVPTHQPGELDVLTAEDYRRWFEGMGEMGVRSVRIYTLHPPAFYDELASYNEGHPGEPLYLTQGVYLPDESYVEPGRTLYTEKVDRAFSAELADVSAAVHGDLAREPALGRASGTWTTDVSQWLMSWIVGVEWDPPSIRRTDRRNVDAAYRPGDYFRATKDASATERWLATHMNTLAEAEAARGISVPIAFVNWPTGDPLVHPEEPQAGEDLVGVDANHVLPTPKWPGGTFASFHAYPYYPDFQRYEPGLRKTRWQGRVDTYAGYLRSLADFHPTMPVLVTEFGVPSSIGSAHRGPRGRDQGNHTEQEATAINADLLRLIEEQGMGGGYLFSWTDEWFKRTWNTQEHQLDGVRRQLWHDPLTNEQWFGVVATDPGMVPDSGRELTPPDGPLEYVLATADASYVYLDLTMREDMPEQVSVLVDTLPGPEATDYRIDIDLEEGTGRAMVREDLDPIRLDTDESRYQPDSGKPWHLYRQIINRAIRVRGEEFPAEFEDVGNLVEGTWDVDAEGYDSLATWQVDVEQSTLKLRVPWPMLGLADPSSRTALGEGIPARAVPVEGLGLTLDVDGVPEQMDYTWPTWNSLDHTERLKAGHEELASAYADLAP